MNKKIIAGVAATALILGSAGYLITSNTVEAANQDGTGVRKLDGTGNGQKNGNGRNNGGGRRDGNGQGRRDGTGLRSQTGECTRR